MGREQDKDYGELEAGAEGVLALRSWSPEKLRPEERKGYRGRWECWPNSVSVWYRSG